MKKNKKNGYAIMFTVILVSIISLIGIGLSNTTYKQLLLSSGAKDSQVAFYMSDMATECALYFDNVFPKDPIPTAFPCGVDSDGFQYILSVSNPSTGYYELIPPNEASSDPCFRITIEKLNEGTETRIRASGYNICDTNNSRALERTIEVTY